MTNAEQWRDRSAQQLVRYEALVQLLDDIQVVDDLPKIAQRVARQWKYFANVACWRLAVADEGGFLVVDGARGEATLLEVQTLSPWDAHHWALQRPCLIGVDEAEQRPAPPEHLVGRGVTEVQILPFIRSDRCTGLLSVGARHEAFNDLDNKFIRLFGGQLTDRISDLLRRRFASRMIRESEARYRGLAENSADWIWAMSLDGRTTYTNDLGLQLLGLTREEIGETDLMALVHPDDRGTLMQTFAHAANNGQGWRNVLIRWRTSLGDYRAFESNASPMFD
ncbi:MAG: PAS domain-containing protein, partial [Rhodocyclaceae bacterium]